MTAAACRKVRHKSRSAAYKAVSLLRERGDITPMRVYLCKACGAWHCGKKRLGTKEKLDRAA